VAYDEFIVPYDGRMVAKLKENTLGMNCHCRGRTITVDAFLPQTFVHNRK